MNRHQRTELQKRLAELPKSERDALYDEARRRRSDARKRRSAKSRESIDGERVGGKRRADPLEDWVLRLLEKKLKGDASDDQRTTRDDIVHRGGTVIGLTKRIAAVLPDIAGDETPEPLDCRLSAELAGRQQTGIAVGDHVLFVEREDPGGGAPREVIRVEPRRSRLSRPDPSDPRLERVVAANVDAVVIVVSVKTPPLHPRLIDRYLVAIERGGGSPIVAVNKADLLPPDELEAELAQLDPYRAAGIPIAVCTAAPGDGGASKVSELRALLAGKTCAFVGHSGVGKSSIANALDPNLGLDTGGLREQDQRGRHTTTSSSMHDVGDGIRVIDTPGIRFFGLHDITPEELAASFPEFDEFTGDCKFRDCSHTHEPVCGVRDAAESGALDRNRYETYTRLLDEIAGEPDGPPTERIRPLPSQDDPGAN